MPQTWPASLSKRQMISGYSEDLPQMGLRSETDHGPAKLRRRFTAAPRKVTFNILGTSTDADVLDTFFVTTCYGGTDSFNMVNPRTGSTDEYRFLEPPKFAPASDTHWRMACSIEKLP